MNMPWITLIVILFSVHSLAQSPWEQKIDAAFLTSVKEDTHQLTDLISGMEASASDDHRYWKAYALYKETIVHYVYEREDEAEAALDRAIELLDAIGNKNSDEYALLSMATGFSIPFSPIMAPIYGQRAENYAKKALEKDNQNIRAHYALANTDYYKPAMFGGGEYVEKHLLTAVNLPEQSAKSGRATSWGMPEVYKLLVRYYNREDRKPAAKLYLNKARKLFPEDQQLVGMKVK